MASSTGHTKGQHGRDPALRKFQRKACIGHTVLPGDTATHVVHLSGAVDGGGQVTGVGNALLANEDDEIVVRRMDAGMAFGLQGGAEEDEILADGRV